MTSREGNVEVGASRTPFGGRPAPGLLVPAGDGTRLLGIVPESGAGATPLTLVIDWAAELGPW